MHLAKQERAVTPLLPKNNFNISSTCNKCLNRFNDNFNVPYVLALCSHTLCSSCLAEGDAWQRKCGLCGKAIQSQYKNTEALQLLTTVRSEDLCGIHGYRKSL